MKASGGRSRVKIRPGNPAGATRSARRAPFSAFGGKGRILLNL
ncbi:hypothetical protein B4135_3954 [Caldibacillus debilis]|uniref:Uncharacterized protein n=1 Tax=Caldibacillus debilis TaxID=301148 RepID=A0A150L9M0_9BACI|nr:hypothetical protein B4135_3954 [Caldibacillus debilis]